MKSFLKYLYRCLQSLVLKFRGVRISPLAFFNHKTSFEGANNIHKGAHVSNSDIGYGTYIGENTQLINCRIGRYCSIASDIKVVSATHPTKCYVSTSPMFFSTLKQTGLTYCDTNKFNESLLIDNRCAIIGNDVWIGDGATIKGGVRVGDGAIIAMNACVTSDVPPYAIVGGVPAKIIRYRFSSDQIHDLLSIAWWNKPEDWIIKHAHLFTAIDEFLTIVKNEDSTCNNSCSI